jgi:PPP family 3-phenylpropionic acid transporter
VLYSFGSIHWRALGFTGFDIGEFWAIGVCCEILVFSQSRRLTRLLGPLGLLAVGAVAAIVRWSLFSTDPGFAGVLALQVLHGLTFGGTYLGNQHAIVRVVPEEMTASAQGLYGSLSAILLAGSTALAGPLYESFGAKAFLAMTVSPVLALAIVAAYAYLSPRGPARQE